MAFTEEQEYKLEIIPPYNTIQVRRADIVKKDGVEVGRTYHRHVVVPGADTTNEPDVVKKTAAALHDAATVTAYTDSLAE